MSKGQKTITHHEFPVITVKQIGKQYDIAGKEVREVRAKLEALGYIEPIRKGSHTYKLLKCCLPHTLAILDEDYIAAKYTYTLPQDYPAIRQTLADLIAEVKKLSNKSLEEYIRAKYTSALEGMEEALILLDDVQEALALLPKLLPDALNNITFYSVPPYPDSYQPISRQKRLENFKKLLKVVYENLYGANNLYIYISILQPLALAIDVLEHISIPSNIQERNRAKCAQ